MTGGLRQPAALTISCFHHLPSWPHGHLSLMNIFLSDKFQRTVERMLERTLYRWSCGLLIGMVSIAAQAQAPAAGITQAVVDNPYGLAALWAQGDFVARGTLFILVLMSVGSWYILVTRLAASQGNFAKTRRRRARQFLRASGALPLRGSRAGSARR